MTEPFHLSYDGISFEVKTSQYNDQWLVFEIARRGTLSHESFLMLREDVAKLLAHLHSFLDGLPGNN